MGTLDTWVRIGVFAVGVFGLIVFFRSILRVAVLNRRQIDWLASHVGNLVRIAVVCVARRQRSYGDVQKTIGWCFPIYNFSLIVAWFLLVQISFACMIWALEFDKDWLRAFIASGSALSTLGFATPSNVVGQLLGVLEGGFGLGIVVFMFTFIPGYRTAVQVREDMVGWMYARVSARPTPFSLVEWCQIEDGCENMTPIWHNGEAWFRGLLETHALEPLLVLVPSDDRDRTWVGAAAAMLDAASFAMSSLNVKGAQSARLCHTTGVNALRLIIQELPGVGKVEATRTEDVGRLAAAYDAAYDKFAAAGLAMKPDRDECRRHFLDHRSRYEGLVRCIAESALMPIDEPWVLPRAKAVVSPQPIEKH